MAINFPAAPSTNQTYTYNGRTWTWNGVGWQATGSTGLTVYTKTTFTATAGQTSFSATYTVGFVDVYYNGSKLSTSEYTATTGSTVVLGTACAVGDIVETIAWTISSSFNPSLGSASATSLALGGATIGTNALAVTGTTALSGLLTAAGGISSTLVTDATSATTGSIITAGGISTQKALWVGTTSRLVGNTQHDGLVGIGMTPVNVLDITQTQNGSSRIKLLNADTTASGAAIAELRLSNSASNAQILILGTGYAASGVVRADGLYIANSGAGGITINTAAVQPIYFGINATEVARFTAAGMLNLSGTSTSGNVISGTASQGYTLLQLLGTGTGGYSGVWSAVAQNNYNGANCANNVGRDSGTGRSINAGGTVNASGADYAEYMLKADSCGVLAKGAVAGVNADGKLTDKFSDAHSFVIKSTDPSYVGGDTWGNGDAIGEKPMPPQGEGSEEDMLKYEVALAEWRELHEASRATVDRIAFSGQVPVNVTGATVGDYIVPVSGPDGGIAGEAVTNPTFDQYRAAVGRVWKILEDGRAFVSVKVS